MYSILVPYTEWKLSKKTGSGPRLECPDWDGFEPEKIEYLEDDISSRRRHEKFTLSETDTSAICGWEGEPTAG